MTQQCRDELGGLQETLSVQLAVLSKSLNRVFFSETVPNEPLIEEPADLAEEEDASEVEHPLSV